MIQHLGLDRPWARREDPAELLISIFEVQGDLGLSTYLSRETASSTAGASPCAAARARRAPSASSEPVEGWELVSAGPDGQADADDVVGNPHGRVTVERDLRRRGG
ncbi:MAG: hypothetical protein R3B82_17100 [Sandaracinaceae bacterium]